VRHRGGSARDHGSSRELGYSRLKAYIYVILPLAFRISLPALNNNLVNLVKTTTIAYAIAVPEMLYVRPDLVIGRVERAGDDERAAHRLCVAGRPSRMVMGRWERRPADSRLCRR